jgi:hypothetical protein
MCIIIDNILKVMKQKLKNVGLLAVLSVLTMASASNFASASLPDDSYSHRHTTALYDPNLVCGDHLCGLHEKKAPSHANVGIQDNVLLP